MNQLISVVITTYKRDKRYVKEALDSVVNQTYSPIEILVIDDNGTGSEYEVNLKDLCKQYPNVRYIQNERNSGAQVSRNNGIKASKGEYIAFLDDDDIWDLHKIEKQVELFSDDTVGMVYCDGYSFEDGNMKNLGVFREASIYDRPITHDMEMFNDYVGSTSQALIRKDVFDDVGMFDVDMPARQDYEMWLRISRKYKIVGCPEKLLFYRIHPGERISKNLDKCFRSYELVLKKYSDDYDNNRYAKSKIILRLFSTKVKMKDYVSAMGYLAKAFITSPVCVYHVVLRKLQKRTFEEFYRDKI